jgi:hypothetical protein
MNDMQFNRILKIEKKKLFIIEKVLKENSFLKKRTEVFVKHFWKMQKEILFHEKFEKVFSSAYQENMLQK